MVRLRLSGCPAIILPGSFTTETNHFANAGHPADTATEKACEAEYAGLMDAVGKSLATLAPPDADVREAAKAIVKPARPADAGSMRVGK